MKTLNINSFAYIKLTKEGERRLKSKGINLEKHNDGYFKVQMWQIMAYLADNQDDLEKCLKDMNIQIDDGDLK